MPALGKKDHFETLSDFTEQIKQAANFAEPQKRIGELFLAFGKIDTAAARVIDLLAE